MKQGVVMVLVALLALAAGFKDGDAQGQAVTLEERVAQVERELAALQTRLAARTTVGSGSLAGAAPGQRAQATITRLAREVATLSQDLRRVESEVSALHPRLELVRQIARDLDPDLRRFLPQPDADDGDVQQLLLVKVETVAPVAVIALFEALSHFMDVGIEARLDLDRAARRAGSHDCSRGREGEHDPPRRGAGRGSLLDEPHLLGVLGEVLNEKPAADEKSYKKTKSSDPC